MLESSRLVCFVKATPLPLLFLFITCSGHTTYYVKSTPNTSCPVHLCLTLSEYAQQPHIYGTSNTTLLLLPGDHVLTVNFTVEDTTDFEICAKVSSHIENHAVTVVCQGMVGLMFRNISQVALEGLTFTSCGKGEVMYSPVYSDYMTTYMECQSI